jgi:hypothetical protein
MLAVAISLMKNSEVLTFTLERPMSLFCLVFLTLALHRRPRTVISSACAHAFATVSGTQIVWLQRHVHRMLAIAFLTDAWEGVATELIVAALDFSLDLCAFHSLVGVVHDT